MWAVKQADQQFAVAAGKVQHTQPGVV